MKIVCQSCSATYKIADDKVQGKKVFKIKCKKCGEDILVRGTDAPAEQEQPQHHIEKPPEDEQTRIVSNEGGEAVWHAVLNGDQQGPYTLDQLRELMGQGAIDTETYVWRDGFEGWLPMRDVPDLAVLTVGQDSGGAGGGDLFAGSSTIASSPAPSVEARPSMRAEPAKARIAPKGGDLFAPEAREQEAARSAFPEEPKAPVVVGGGGGGENLTGQRNENSVLFSLATLQQLSDKNAKPAAAANPDASGLIDINKLAGALNTVGSPSGPSGKKSSVDDILSVGASAGLASPLAAPVLAPVAVPSTPAPAVAEPVKPQGVNKTVLATGIAVAAILVGGGVVGAYLMSRNNQSEAQQNQQVAMNTPPPAATNPAVAPPVAPPVAAPTPPPAAQPAAAPPTTPEAAPNRDRERDRERERSHGSSGSGSSGSSAAAAPTPAPAAAAHAPAAAPSRPSGPASIDDLLNRVTATPRAGSPSPSPSPAPAAAAGGLPETPDRASVRSVLSGLSSSVRSCGTGSGGTAMVTIVFANSGRVTQATVNGIPPGPAVGCIVTAVRRASLPPFSRATFSVTYPYPIN